MTQEVPLLYEDDWFVVVDKPAKLLSVPGRGPDKQDCVMSRVENRLGAAFAVHRLDYATSGLLLVARTEEAQRRLYEQFRLRRIEKEYHAVLRGQLQGESGLVSKPLICDWPNRPRQMICRIYGKPATTRWQVIARQKDQTRVRLEPITGRSHQLRVHMQSLGHPILGDEFYDSVKPTSNERMRLHAYRLDFEHPFTGAPLRFVAPCPF